MANGSDLTPLYPPKVGAVCMPISRSIRWVFELIDFVGSELEVRLAPFAGAIFLYRLARRNR